MRAFHLKLRLRFLNWVQFFFFVLFSYTCITTETVAAVQRVSFKRVSETGSVQLYETRTMFTKIALILWRTQISTVFEVKRALSHFR